MKSTMASASSSSVTCREATTPGAALEGSGTPSSSPRDRSGTPTIDPTASGATAAFAADSTDASFRQLTDRVYLATSSAAKTEHELPQGVGRGPAEAVDRLVGVADRHDGVVGAEHLGEEVELRG